MTGSGRRTKKSALVRHSPASCRLPLEIAAQRRLLNQLSSTPIRHDNSVKLTMERYRPLPDLLQDFASLLAEHSVVELVVEISLHTVKRGMSSSRNTVMAGALVADLQPMQHHCQHFLVRIPVSFILRTVGVLRALRVLSCYAHCASNTVTMDVSRWLMSWLLCHPHLRRWLVSLDTLQPSLHGALAHTWRCALDLGPTLTPQHAYDLCALLRDVYPLAPTTSLWDSLLRL